MSVAIDITWLRCGFITALCEAGTVREGSLNWICRCDCGRLTVKTAKHITAGRAKSCGCQYGRWFGPATFTRHLDTVSIAHAIGLEEAPVANALARERDRRFACADSTGQKGAVA